MFLISRVKLSTRLWWTDGQDDNFSCLSFELKSKLSLSMLGMVLICWVNQAASQNKQKCWHFLVYRHISAGLGHPGSSTHNSHPGQPTGTILLSQRAATPFVMNSSTEENLFRNRRKFLGPKQRFWLCWDNSSIGNPVQLIVWTTVLRPSA